MSATGGEAEKLARMLASNPSYAGFISHEFDTAAYASAVVLKDGAGGGGVDGAGRSHAEVCAADLRGHIGEIESTIHAHARAHHEELLSRVGSVKELNHTTDAVSADAADLRTSMERIGRELLAPHARMAAKVAELGRIQACGALLRDVMQFNYAAKRLRKQLHAAAAVEQAGFEDAARYGKEGGGGELVAADTQDLALAAQSLHELEMLLGEDGSSGSGDGDNGRGRGSLRRIGVVEEQAAWIEQEGSRVRSRAAAAARAALLVQAQSELADALQVSFNLRELPSRVAELAATAAAVAADGSRAAWGELVAAAERACAEASANAAMADDMVMGGGGMVGGADGAAAEEELGADPRWHAAVWSRVERVLEGALEAAMQLWNLRRVLAKKRDAASRQPFLRCVLRGHLEAPQPQPQPQQPQPQPQQLGMAGAGAGLAPLFDGWWAAVAKAIRRSLETQLRGSSPLSAALAARYPKLRRAARRTAQRIFRGTSLAAAEMSDAGGAVVAGGKGGTDFDANVDEAYLQEVAVSGDLRSGGFGVADHEKAAAAAATPAGAFAAAQLRSRTTLRVLLRSFAPVRCSFLREAAATLQLPVSQMFPDAAGYVPSPPGRHDIDTFVRSFGAVLRDARDAMGAPECIAAGIGGGGSDDEEDEEDEEEDAEHADGDTAFLLSLARTALLPAVASLSSGLGSLHSTGRDAFAFSASSWARNEVQQHNLALVVAAFRLRDGLAALPTLLAPEMEVAAEAAEVTEEEERTRAGNNTAAASYAAAASRQLHRGLTRCVRPSMRLLRALSAAVLTPYLAAAGRQVGRLLARMHLEHFGAAGASATEASSAAVDGSGTAAGDAALSPPVGAEACSAYMADLRAAVARLSREHLEKLPVGGSADREGVTGATAAEDLAAGCLKQLAAAVMRAFARHITLVRPLGESGKLRLAADMAHFELATEPLLAAAKGPSKLKLSDLGPAYGELRSLRQLLFVKSEDLLTHPESTNVRPSLVWHLLLSRGPPELQSPHAMLGIEAHDYVEWAEGGAGSGVSATQAAQELRDGKLQLLELPISHTLQAEAAVWEHIKASLDSYTRRVSATAGGAAEADGAACALLQRSSMLLGRYEGALLTATTD